MTDNLGRSSWEFSRGYAEVGETGEQAAKREGAEETGSKVIAAMSIGEICGNTAIEPHFITITVGLVDKTKAVKEKDPNEKLLSGLNFFPPDQMREKVANEIYCGITLGAFAKLTAIGTEHVLRQLLHK